MPPLAGPRAIECWTRYPVNTSRRPSSSCTGMWTVTSRAEERRTFCMPSSRSRRRAAASKRASAESRGLSSWSCKYGWIGGLSTSILKPPPSIMDHLTLEIRQRVRGDGERVKPVRLGRAEVVVGGHVQNVPPVGQIRTERQAFDFFGESRPGQPVLGVQQIDEQSFRDRLESRAAGSRKSGPLGHIRRSLNIDAENLFEFCGRATQSIALDHQKFVIVDRQNFVDAVLDAVVEGINEQ